MNDGFENPAQRRGTASVKWDTCAINELPLWVADMDFAPPACVNQAIQKRLEHAFLGYSMAKEEWQKAVQTWCGTRQEWKPERPVPLQGLMSGISAALLCLTEANSTILVEGPVYHPFYSVPPALGRQVESMSLETTIDKNANSDGTRAVNINRSLDKLALRLEQGQVGAFLLCSPHNPGGRIWTREELIALANLLAKHNVPLVVDEIHADTLRQGQDFVSCGKLCAEDVFKNISLDCIVLQAPTKTFNIAGISSAWAVASTPALQDKYRGLVASLGLEVLNILSYEAAEAVYRSGYEWLEKTQSQIDANLQTCMQWVKKYNIKALSTGRPSVAASMPQASYLFWLYIGDVYKDGTRDLVQELRQKGLRLNPGAQFGREGEGFLRINVACHPSVLDSALKILESNLNDL